MRSLHALTLLTLAAATSASPLQLESNPAPLTKRTLFSNETLEACIAAPNCETYEDPNQGTLIRFVKGMEPGSAHYRRLVRSKAKRDDSFRTHVTVGKESLVYGSVKASGDGGVIHHLYDACHEGSCDTAAVGVESTFAGPTNKYTATVQINPSGQYDGWEQRDIFVEAIVAVAGQGEECKDVDWINGGGYYGGVQSGTVNMCTQTDFISVNRFSQDGHLMGFMQVKVDYKETDDGWCGKITGILGGLSSIIGLIPGAEVIGGSGAAFFGAISPFCQ